MSGTETDVAYVLQVFLENSEGARAIWQRVYQSFADCQLDLRAAYETSQFRIGRCIRVAVEVSL